MTAFDGDATSRADREFLARLGDHRLAWNSFYGKPCPPQPDFGAFRPEEDNARQAKRKAFFATVIDWMLVNYAYREGAFVSKGGAISLVDGEIISLADLRARMAPWALLAIGPHGGIKMHSPVDDWLRATTRLSVRREEMRPDRPRPTFAEDGHAIFNRYRPPAHPIDGGNITWFEAFLARLIPDDAERRWFWNWLAHKARRPWVPSVAIIMVAEEFGSGRGTLFDILELLFGRDYVVPCGFGELTGAAAGARFNARLADALIAVVNEAVAEDGHQQAQRRLAADLFEPRHDVVLPRVDEAHDHRLRPIELRSNHRVIGAVPTPPLRFRTGVDDLPPLAVCDAIVWLASLAQPAGVLGDGMAGLFPTSRRSCSRRNTRSAAVPA